MRSAVWMQRTAEQDGGRARTRSSFRPFLLYRHNHLQSSVFHVIVGTQYDAEEIQLTANTRKAAQHLQSLACTVYMFQKQP